MAKSYTSNISMHTGRGPSFYSLALLDLAGNHVNLEILHQEQRRSSRPRRPFGGFSKPSLLRTIGKLMIDC